MEIEFPAADLSSKDQNLANYVPPSIVNNAHGLMLHKMSKFSPKFEYLAVCLEDRKIDSGEDALGA